MLDPNDFIIARKRKKYKFAVFANSPICFEVDEWPRANRPNILEVGAGTGLFGISLAKNNVKTAVLAVDVKADRLQAGARIAEAEALSNISFLRSRVDQLPGVLAPASFREIWVTFPDPFPKDRSAKHRLTHPKFLEIYRQLLAPGGALYFKTDAAALFEWSLEQLIQEGWRLEELSFDLHGSTLSAGYKVMTAYEKRFTAEGIKISFAKATPPS